MSYDGVYHTQMQLRCSCKVSFLCFRFCHVMQFYFLCPEINLISRTLLVAKSAHEPNNAIGHHNIHSLTLIYMSFDLLQSYQVCFVQCNCCVCPVHRPWLPCLILFIHFMIMFIWIFEGEVVRLMHGKKRWKGRGQSK